jgi:hypothetical protein
VNPQANSRIEARQAIDEAASAIQSLARAFTDNRTANAVRNDLELARVRLAAAIKNVTIAQEMLKL